ncbi:type II toxin-antitoxin system HicB family antitoxin [Enterococcus faecium]|uniref:type II toxin-antitoxin system HicB family antitoxin n=1 Tax=Enterococcus faecium TaxID=1352 RepID=UPI00220067A5|nr:type II toxin-antitoxin system HicB family antitoxin [Enterococcus faecium]BDP48418.1 HicB family protein [Enterococcus faecium]
MKKSYPVIFSAEENGYSVVFPDFAGATQGDNFEEAMSNAKEFLDGILAYYIDEDISVPSPTDIHQLNNLGNNKIVSLIQSDPSPFIQKRQVRKNVTVPEWLVARGEKDKINFSKVLTDALLKIYE